MVEDNRTYEERINKIVGNLQLGETKLSGDSIQMCCPIHYEDNPSFGINAVNGAFHCFACGVKGHISKFPYYLRSNILAEETDSILDFEVTAKIDTVSYSAKPSGGEIGSIRNRLADVSLSKYTIRELLEQIITGHTVSLSGAKNNSEWAGQQVVMIDIDNDCQATMDDIIEYATSVGLEPTFAYHTYSSTEDVCRCRLAYVFKEPITDKKMYLDILKRLFKIFKCYSVDTKCNDLSRIFYGTMNTEVYVSNLVYYHRFTAEQINEVEIIIGTSSKSSRANSKTSDVESSEVSKFFDGRIFLHHIFGQYMIDNYYIIRLNGNQLHIYKGRYLCE